MPHFVNPKVGAVAGNAKVGNRVNLWTRWQALEYITSQNFERRALNTLGAVSVVPGAIGAWRTSAVQALGGYHTDTVAEDADLTMALLRNGYRVEYEDRALAYTEAPIDTKASCASHFRWSFGIACGQSISTAKFLPKKGVLGWIALPNIVVFQILLPLVSPVDIMFTVGAPGISGRIFSSESTVPPTSAAGNFSALTMMISTGDCIGTRAAPRHARGYMAAEPGLAATFAYRQLFSRLIQDGEARAPKVRPLRGQAGTHPAVTLRKKKSGPMP